MQLVHTNIFFKTEDKNIGWLWKRFIQENVVERLELPYLSFLLLKYGGFDFEEVSMVRGDKVNVFLSLIDAECS